MSANAKHDPPDQSSGAVPLDSASSTSEQVASLAHTTTTSFGWMLGQTLATKVVNLVGNIVLARLLLKDQFGVFAIAQGIVVFANLIQEAGLQQILVHRGREFNRWANAGFWFANATGLAGAGLLLLASPLLSAAYHRPELAGLIVVLALRAPVNALSTLPGSRLKIELRFNVLAIVETVLTFIQVALSIFLAVLLHARYANYGAYSFVLPLLLVALLRPVILWRIAPTPVRWKLEFSRWRLFLGDSTFVFLSGFLVAITAQGDYLILGHLHSSVVVGIYFFAFSLTLQTTQFLTVNLASVLFPTLSRLQNEPQRQCRAFLRATQLLMLLGVPLCLLQIAAAAPLVRLLFGTTWLAAVPVLQVISIAMSVQLVYTPALNMIQAQGRFPAMMLVSLACALSFLVLVYAAAVTGHVGGPDDGMIRWPWLQSRLEWIFRVRVDVSVMVALAVLVQFAISSPLVLYTSIARVGGAWNDVAAVYGIPFLISIPAVFAGAIAGHFVPVMPGGDCIRLLVISLVAGAVYIPLMRLMAGDAWNDMIERTRALIKR